jgi:hypothetical protein
MSILACGALALCRPVAQFEQAWRAGKPDIMVYGLAAKTAPSPGAAAFDQCDDELQKRTAPTRSRDPLDLNG